MDLTGAIGHTNFVAARKPLPKAAAPNSRGEASPTVGAASPLAVDPEAARTRVLAVVQADVQRNVDNMDHNLPAGRITFTYLLNGWTVEAEGERELTPNDRHVLMALANRARNAATEAARDERIEPFTFQNGDTFTIHIEPGDTSMDAILGTTPAQASTTSPTSEDLPAGVVRHNGKLWYEVRVKVDPARPSGNNREVVTNAVGRLGGYEIVKGQPWKFGDINDGHRTVSVQIQRI